MHVINKLHAFDQEASYMLSRRIMHVIKKHHVQNSIKDDITSLIATYKRYALVILCKLRL